MNREHTNSLADETSPYLLQHAHNPVDWHAWDEEALEKARKEDKPILLSIGYSACHWCHVMAHESFEDEEVASLMNALFVNIKVDREERPDLDRIHQLAHQALTRRPGGWPLTMFLSPDDRTPFFGGTYFPKEPRHGMPSFPDVLRRVEAFYREHEEDLKRQNESLRHFLEQVTRVDPMNGALDAGPLETAAKALEQQYDRDHGGFTGAPKFPHPAMCRRLLRLGATDRAERKLAAHCLHIMATRGLFDHVGGGFYRYCVDTNWSIPHFEKMLYDNGALLGLYAEGSVLLEDPALANAANLTADWMLREMKSPEGGFYSSLDADSEGEEGKYYVWRPEQVKQLLNAEEWAAFEPAYGLDKPPNFEAESWHLQRLKSDESVAEKLAIDEDTVRERLNSALVKLHEAREERVRPGLDDKQLAGWNGLAAAGLAQAGRFLDRDDCIEAASATLRFVRENLWVDGKLRASYKDGRARFDANLDDHAYLLEACIHLLQARWDANAISLAQDLAEALLERFEDRDNGSFYFTAHDHEKLIQRPRPLADEATPSGNGIAALNIQRLGHLLAEPRYLDAAERTLKAAWAHIQEAPHAHASLMEVLDENLEPPRMVILRGPGKHLGEWQAALAQSHRPGRLAFAIPSGEEGLPKPLQNYQPADDVTAWVCEGTQCSAPITEWTQLEKALA